LVYGKHGRTTCKFIPFIKRELQSLKYTESYVCERPPFVNLVTYKNVEFVIGNLNPQLLFKTRALITTVSNWDYFVNEKVND